MIALIDYGAGNLRSVHKALKFVGADVRVVTKPSELQGMAGLVLPGVGSFDDCLNALQRQELIEASRLFIKTGKPFLGICVGYQALFDRSDEFNSCALGLKVFEGSVIKFGEQAGLKIPQIGWNKIHLTQTNCPLYKGIADCSYVYFVHSFHPAPIDRSIIATETDYGNRFASSVWKDNVYATQFHPEKSQRIGLQLLKNFVDLCA